MRTYKEITILFADEEPAMCYADAQLAQTVLERCEEWREKMAASETELSVGAITPMQHVGVMGHLGDGLDFRSYLGFDPTKTDTDEQSF